MASLRDIRKRIRSVKSTQKITRAMKLVSAAKLRRAQQAIVAARPYATSLHKMITRIAARSGREDGLHPLLDHRHAKNRILVIVLTSDRGMAGAFNANVLKAADRFIAEKLNTYKSVAVATVGRRGRDYYKKRRPDGRREYPGVLENVTFATAKKIAEEATAEYLNDELDAVYLVYNEFKSAIAQEVVAEQLLPIEKAADAGADLDYVYEPNADNVLKNLLPQYLATQIFRALLESQASEHGARMSAMENATKNASEMIGSLTLVYNRVRQAGITRELIEIMSGAEAQKG